MTLPRTPSQTVGPFFALMLPWRDGEHVVSMDSPGFWLCGRVLDGQGVPVPDAMVETWQSSPQGRFDDPDFKGVARSLVDSDGRYAVRTQKPGSVIDSSGSAQAPHIDVSVFARGLLKRVVTRIYFADEDVANAKDPVLNGVGDSTARDTLIASPSADGYVFDIRLQGDQETVFFDV